MEDLQTADALAGDRLAADPPAADRFVGWGARQWATAGLGACLYAVAVAVPTDLVDTPWFGRQIAPTWWSWPALLVTAVLAGLLTATYVRTGGAPAVQAVSADRRGVAGGLLTFFAVGCPVCNKLVLLALGSAGALAWFQPVQPVLQVVAIGLLGWALRRRLGVAVACRTPTPR